MRLVFVVGALGLVATSVASFPVLATPQADHRVADRDAIRQHIAQIFDAYIRADRPAIRKTHSDNWRGYVSNSREIIRGIDQYMQAADAVQQATRMTAYTITDMDTVFYGDVAVVPYIAEVDLSVAGARISSKLRVLDVYAKMNGHWIQVASNTAVHPDAQAAFEQQPFPVNASLKQALMGVREQLWRAYFDDDQARLQQMIPTDAIAIDAGQEPWQSRDEILASASRFAKTGGTLARMEFPKTEIQMYGPIAVLYSTYRLDIDTAGARQKQAGRATEIFVNRQGHWVNVGWHLDSGQ